MRRRTALICAAVSAVAIGAPTPAGGASAEPVILLAAGDIASCKSPGDEATAAILDREPGVVATLGDNAYEHGTPAEFAKCYHPSWGRHRGRTRPSVGNHEYRTPGAAGYFGYFGAAAGDPLKGYYSYDLGAWHVVALNSNCAEIGGCRAGSPQDLWLRADLAASPADCTLAYFHHARHSSFRYWQLDELEPLWAALYEHGADVVLSGHDHIYERFAPLTPAGDMSPAHGIRQFTVGTGGHSHFRLRALRPTSEVAHSGTFGVLKLTLASAGYDWVFLPEAGKTFTDAGSGACHDAPADTVRPTVTLEAPPDGTIVRGPQVLAVAAADDVAVERVDFLVDATVVASATEEPYELEWDSTTFPDGLRSLRARAIDSFGNADTSPARAIVVDNALPATTLLGKPPADWRLRTATFRFASEPGATFECSLDKAPWKPCRSPVLYTGLVDGRHRFSVRARDAAGNLELGDAVWTWTVDTRPPQTRIVRARGNGGRKGTATFGFAASERRATFACRLDSRPWRACTAPARYTGIRPGWRRFAVRATDAAGNTDWTPAVRVWTSPGQPRRVVFP